MSVRSLAQALAEVGGDRSRALALACAAADEARHNNSRTHSFISVVEDAEIGANLAAGSLLGCVFSVKDNIDMRGLATTCGSRLFENHRPATNAWIVTALQSAGAQCIGKNNMHELALGATGINPHFGTSTTPWDPGRSAGGSSGGSAVAVARRQVHVSIGTDSGGSVRIPASMCGVVGFKPTAGALPLQGVEGAALTMDSLGIFAADVDGIRRIWDVIGPQQRFAAARQPRLAYLQDDSMGRVDARVWDRYREAVETLRGSGMNLVGISMAGFSAAPYVCISIVYPEIASLHYDLVRAHLELYSSDIRLALIYLGELWSARNYVDAQRLRGVLRSRLRAIAQPYDAILSPTAAVQPPRIGEKAQVEGDPSGSELYTFMRFTVALNVNGLPGHFDTCRPGSRRSACRAASHRQAARRRCVA